jgi:colanic acid biosynthesis glycosyl transferase WcaI
MTSKRIIFLNRFFYPDHSATAQMLSDLAFHLVEQDFRIMVVTSNGLYDDPSARLPASETIKGVEVRRVYKPRFGRAKLMGRALDYFWMYLAFGRALLRFASSGDVVVAKTDPPLLSVALLPFARLKGAKVGNWLQDLYPEVAVEFGMKSISALSPILIRLRDASLKTADLNVVIGDRMRKRLLDAGVAGEKIAVIPNWADDAKINIAQEAENPLRAEWGLQDRFVIAYSGNLGRAHEYQTLLGAAERLRETDVTFLFIGGGALTPQLKAEVQSRGLEHLFQFRPYQPKEALATSLTLPDVFWVSLLPSMEGLIVPSKFYGSCAAGKPTIFVGDRCGEIAAIVERSGCGATIEIGDDERLAQTILEWRRDPERVRAMGQAARAALERDYSRAAAFSAWEKRLRAC